MWAKARQEAVKKLRFGIRDRSEGSRLPIYDYEQTNEERSQIKSIIELINDHKTENFWEQNLRNDQ